MAEWDIQLWSGGFRGWLDLLCGYLTKTRDDLSCLVTEERRLSEIWESDAMLQWEKEFQRMVKEMGEYLERMEGLIGKTVEAAEKLVLVEQKLIQEAERL